MEKERETPLDDQGIPQERAAERKYPHLDSLESTAAREFTSRTSVDDLLDELRRTAPEFAKGAALYTTVGSGGITIFDAQRKALYSRIEAGIRGQHEARNEKLTDGKADALSHSHEDYGKFLNDHQAQHEAFLLLDAERKLLIALVAYRIGEVST